MGAREIPLRDMDREQIWLLPPTLDDLLPLDHPARLVAEFVDALDREGWNEVGVKIDGYSLGDPAYHPLVLPCVWLYGFMTGVRSCRKGYYEQGSALPVFSSQCLKCTRLP